MTEDKMNKQDIAHFRRYLKTNQELLTIEDLYHVYILKESHEIFHEESVFFSLLEEDEKELFLQNFKKVLSGQLDKKLFPLAFQSNEEPSTRSILYEGLTAKTGTWKEKMLILVESLLSERQFETDMVITFVRGKYRRPMKRDKMEFEHENDVHNASPFILCTLNETKMPKSELSFDYIEKAFQYQVEVNPIIQLQKPLMGFLFPTFPEGVSNVNRVLYASGKVNEPDTYFLEKVLQVEETTTAQDDKAIFQEVIKQVASDQLNPETIATIYEEAHRTVEESDEKENVTFDYHTMQQLLTTSGIDGIDREKLQYAFQTVAENPAYELKAQHVVPSFTAKSIKIKTKIAEMKIGPQDLKYVKQAHIDGKPCLVIEVDESVDIDGFEMLTKLHVPTE